MINGDPLVLVVEDDKPIRNLIVGTLKIHKYRYMEAQNGAMALIVATSHQPDIVLMDLGLPDLDGVEIIKEIRSWSMCPIIVISARNEEKDKVAALDAGADDYLTKPFSVDELLARLRSTVRRLEYLESKVAVESAIFQNGQLVIDYSAAFVSVKGVEVHLMPMEYSLLCLLAKNVGKVLTHSYILDKIWANSMESDLSSLRVYMASLRKKIEVDCEKGTYIQTHIGIGYRMVRK